MEKTHRNREKEHVSLPSRENFDFDKFDALLIENRISYNNSERLSKVCDLESSIEYAVIYAGFFG